MSKVSVDFRTCEVSISNRLSLDKYSKLLKALDHVADPSLTAMFEVKQETSNAEVPTLTNPTKVHTATSGASPAMQAKQSF